MDNPTIVILVRAQGGFYAETCTEETFDARLRSYLEDTGMLDNYDPTDADDLESLEMDVQIFRLGEKLPLPLNVFDK